MKIKTRSRSIVLASVFLILFLICISSTALASTTQVSNSTSGDTAETYTFVTKWGSYGSEDGQFIYPFGVAVDSSGNVYVADTHNHRIQKFDSNGMFITKWGSEGSEDGQFSYPGDVAVDSSGNIYVADTHNNRIQEFDSNGMFITKWGSYGSEDGQFSDPYGVAVDSSGNVYVADESNHRIQKFDNNGMFITKWGSYGSEDGQFSFPMGVAVDSSGNVYVADYNNYRIQKFDSNGAFITKWGSSGSEDGQFSYPYGVAVDSSGNVYVADLDNNRIQKFDSNGMFITKWGSYGSEDGQFSYPLSVAVDSSGNVFVADLYNHRIQKFTPETPEPIYNPENGHYYEVKNVPNGITWEDANNAAQSSSYLGVNGHLATIDSEYENEFIVNNLHPNYHWLGGFQPDGSAEPDGGWQWITGEPWDYINWDSPEPNEYGNSGEDRLQIYANGYWNDISHTALNTGGYIVEYEPDEHPAPIYNPENGHYYESINVPEGITWQDAKNAAESLSYSGMKGHLVTITNQGESDFLSSNLGSNAGPWIGGYQEAGSAEPGQGWKWITGEEILPPTESGFSNWHMDTGEPNNAGDENRLELWGDTYQWNDLNENVPQVGYVVEYEEQRLPVANFRADVTAGNVPLSVQFTDLSENVVEWNWDFGDGETSSLTNPTHTYVSSGNYTVNLTAINKNGTDSKLAKISVFNAPVPAIANFTANVTSGYAPLTVLFTDISTDAISWNWDFGDGTTSDLKNPTHTYSMAGNYTVTLTVNNKDGVDSKLAKISVSKPVPPEPPVKNAPNVSAPVTVQIGNLSQDANEINWNIGSQHLGTNFSGNGQNISAPVTVQIGNASQNANTINWNIHA